MKKYTFIIFRSIGILALALVAVMVPAVGEGRFLLAVALVLVVLPLSIWIELRFPVEKTGWSEPVFDLTAIILLVHLIPDAWYLAFLTGSLLLGATGVVASRIGYQFYMWLIALFLSGMSFAAFIHDVEGWIPAILAVLVVSPSMLLYAHQEAGRISELHQQKHALKNLSLLAGGVAHDFNNMLTTIKGNTELALLDLSPNHPSQKTLTAAIDGTNRASLLSAQLLAFSGRKTDKKNILDLRSEIKTIANLLESTIPKGVTFAQNITSEQCFVECDQAQIQQVIMNIIINAGEATKTIPSKIHLSLTRESSQADTEQMIVLEIRDEGIGIPSEMLDSVFTPFVTSKPMGHGLGLASAKRVIEEHGGNIVVESKVDVGTRVRIQLPATRKSPAPPKSAEPETNFEHTGLVLIIDDEEQIRQVAGLFLERLGYITTKAKDAYEAVAIFKTCSDDFTAVLLDLKMPGKDGWECLRELREVRADIPVIISSGYNPGEAQPDTYNQAFLVKPYTITEMEKVFRNIVSEKNS